MLVDEIVEVVTLPRLLSALDEVPATVQPGEAALVPSEPTPLPDTTLLRRLVPADLRARMWGAGYLGMHALSFALRNRLTYVALLSHLACGERSELESSPLAHERDREADLATVAGFPWRTGARLPVIGFAALGSYVVPAVAGGCRAFDGYDLPLCGADAQGAPFCALHGGEAFWRGPPPHAASTQAKMFAFYFDRANFGTYDEESLAAMVREFLQHVRESTFSDEEIRQALRRFGFASLEVLRAGGIGELRRTFLRAAHEHHPDKGGEAETFIALRGSYDLLHSVLSRG